MKVVKRTEENIKFEVPERIFYNTKMRFCRSMSSLLVGAINELNNEEKLSIIDGFSASGIRGIRYAKENKNVENVLFIDWNKEAIKTINKNVDNSNSDGNNNEKEKWLAIKLIGYENITNEREEKLLEQFQIHKDDFKLRSIPEISSRGTYRTFFHRF